MGWIPGSGRSPKVGHGKLFQYSCLENSMRTLAGYIPQGHKESDLTSVQFSAIQLLRCVRLFVTPGIAAHQASLSITNSRSSLRLTSIESVMPPSHLILCRSLLLQSPIRPSIRVFSNESTLCMRQPKDEFQLQHHSFQGTPRTHLLQDRLIGSLCSPRDSQESSPIPQFKSINSSVLIFLRSPTLTSRHDHWKIYSLDQTKFCWQSNVSAFEYAIQVGHNFPSKE